MSEPILVCQDLDAGYGSAPVVRAFNLAVRPGEIIAVLGPNGAGKTTALTTMAGLLPPIGGVLRLDGDPLPASKPHVVAQRKLCLIADDRALFPTLTVRENLEVARSKLGRSVDDIVDLFPALRNRLSVRAGSVSGGEQQMLAVARALIQEPKVLLIDEMSTGLAPRIVKDIFAILQRVASEQGAGVVLVEQHVALALAYADRAVVLVHGLTAFSGPAAELRDNRDRLQAMYLGQSPASPSPSSRPSPSEVKETT